MFMKRSYVIDPWHDGECPRWSCCFLHADRQPEGGNYRCPRIQIQDELRIDMLTDCHLLAVRPAAQIAFPYRQRLAQRYSTCTILSFGQFENRTKAFSSVSGKWHCMVV
ncbi:unnamed protein product [Durusdinium trenchii]|uniref:Uncharacterized protein n=1 Tax=Durusdinium trenchii TaxID=1381693 RepID=A0ABP0RUE0_9DINO